MRGLACRRGSHLLFRGLDLTVLPGQLVWVRGANGQGKTSLLRLLAGLSEPAEGTIVRQAALTYVGHQHALKDDLTAQEALTFLLQLEGFPATDALVTDALARLGVKGKRLAWVRTLSQGQKRRVALARLARAPAGGLWLLDEPFDALDDQGLAAVHSLLIEHRRSGGSVVLTSHQDVPFDDVTVLALADPVAGR
ncbi:MAG TPA: heme ABC exporter ATP-binding protein CcmA [Aquabacterium sp.]|nr:heme ABC exporter ATP-binding protein CcmA [Aquabacterium sp.]